MLIRRKTLGFVAGVLAAAILAFIVFWLSLMTVERHDELIAPVFTSRPSLDEKIRFMRQRGPEAADVWALGSSLSLNHLAGSELKNSRGEPLRWVNFSGWGVQAHLWPTLYHWLEGVYPQPPEYLLVASSYIDFRNCRPDQVYDQGITGSFSQTLVSSYMDADWHEYWYHLAVMDWLEVVSHENQQRIARRREHTDDYYSLAFDEYGSVLFTITPEQHDPARWALGRPEPDQQCYSAFEAFLEQLQAKGVQMVYVQTPIWEGYLDRVDPSRATMRRHHEQLQRLLARTGHHFLNAHAGLEWSKIDFVDPNHLHKRGSQRFSRWLSAQLLMQGFNDAP